MQKMSRKDILILVESVILLLLSLYVDGHFFLRCVGSGFGGFGIGWFLRKYLNREL